MAKFVFVKKTASNELPHDGEIQTPSMEATVKYELDLEGDKDIYLTIDGQYFDVNDLQYFIDFLTSAKEALQ